jgi:hypothetical protein
VQLWHALGEIAESLDAKVRSSPFASLLESTQSITNHTDTYRHYPIASHLRAYLHSAPQSALSDVTVALHGSDPRYTSFRPKQRTFPPVSRPKPAAYRLSFGD